MTVALLLMARAHNPDTSYVRVTLGAEEIEVRFTFDIFTVQRMAVVDANGDFAVSREELEGAAAQIFDYLRGHVLFEIDMREAEFGEGGAIGWPEEAGDAVALADYHRQLVSFPFVKRVKAMPEDFYIGFEVFEALTGRHKVIGTIVNGEKQDEIEFTFYEPDYLYDTGYRRTQWHHGWPARLRMRG